MDARLSKPIYRQIVLDIIDHTPIDIPSHDLDTIAEEFEEILKRRYDVTIDGIRVVQRSEDRR